MALLTTDSIRQLTFYIHPTLTIYFLQLKRCWDSVWDLWTNVYSMFRILEKVLPSHHRRIMFKGGSPKVCYSDRFFFFQSFMHNTAFFRTPHFPKLHSQSKYFSFHHHQLLFYNKPHTWLMFVTTPQLSVTITCNIYSITRAVHFQFGRDKPQTSKIRIFRNSLVIIIIIVNAGDYFNGSPLITRLIINPQHGGSHYENVLCVDRVP